MRASSRLIEHIKRSEACALAAYQDAKGVWTIGYGHTAGVKKGDRITQYQADMFLRDDLRTAEEAAGGQARPVRCYHGLHIQLRFRQLQLFNAEEIHRGWQVHLGDSRTVLALGELRR